MKKTMMVLGLFVLMLIPFTANQNSIKANDEMVIRKIYSWQCTQVSGHTGTCGCNQGKCTSQGCWYCGANVVYYGPEPCVY